MVSMTYGSSIMKNSLSVVLVLCALTASVAVAQTSVDETKPVKPDGIVQISNVAGSVDVVAWERPEVHLSGTLERRVERVEFDVRDGRTSIRVVIPERGGRDIAAHLTVSLPAASRIEVNAVSASVRIEDPAPPDTQTALRQSVLAKSVSGNVDVRTWASAVEIKSVSGDVSFDGAAETLDAETVSGKIECSGAHSVDARTTSGDIECSGAALLKARTTSGNLLGEEIGHSAEASSISGSIELSIESMNRVSARTVSGEIEIEGALAPEGRVNASSQSGSIELGLPGDVSAEFDLSSISGRIKTGFGISAEGVNRSLNFTLGTGDGQVRLSTTSGSVTIGKI